MNFKDVLYVPNFGKKIMSSGKMLNGGGKVKGDEFKYVVVKDNIRLR